MDNITKQIDSFNENQVVENPSGRYKIVKPKDIINAAKIVKEGKVYDLSVEVNRKSSNIHGSDKDIFPEYNLVTYLGACPKIQIN